METPKLLYTFSVETEKLVDKIEQVTENGQTYSKTSKVPQKVPTKFALRKPRRSELDDIRLFRGIMEARSITQGFLTRGMIVNKYANETGGLYNEVQQKELKRWVDKYNEIDVDLKQAKHEGAPQERVDELSLKLTDVAKTLFDIQTSNDRLFSNSAEQRAEEQTLAYMVYVFTMVERNGKFVPYFEGEDEEPEKRFNLKRKFAYDLYDKEDEVYLLDLEFSKK